jgi:carboxyl-terminal processing protease
MKKKLLLFLLASGLASWAFALDAGNLTPPLLKPMQQQTQAAHLAAEFLTRYHYKAMPLDRMMSEKIFDRYMKALDAEKIFFLQADIDRFAENRGKLDEAILKEDLKFPFAIFNLYEQRVAERFAHARSLLKRGFDFEQKETYRYEREKESWPKSDAEAREIWRKRVKNDWLRLKLAGKDGKSIVETLDKRYERYLARSYKIKSEDVFQIFMNAYTTSIEPHTNYLGPRAAESFDIEMKLSLHGIGAVLQEKDEYTTIRDFVAGGPAALSGKLKVGDRIVGVAQGERGPMIDVLGWRVDDTVALIRGAADSVVVLEVFPADAGPDDKHLLVTLTRKKISLEQQAAKKSIIEVKDGEATRRIGVVSLPTFYQDFVARKKGEPDFKSATRDVSRILDELRKEKVDSVLIDLRNNGGGSLNEAVELTGLFIDTGPVVQERNSKGKVTVERDDNAGVSWEGPLGVLINRSSASASEIFAAAIQDYGRGVIIGEPSFGKGTVQTMINLDHIAKNDKPKFGDIKMTIAQFYRINGGTTQLRGVTPDIRFSSVVDAENHGESSYDNALPWGQIKGVEYTPTGDLAELLPLLQTRHAARIARDKDFQYLQEDLAESSVQRKKGFISLNEAERRKERDAQEAKMKLRDKNASAGSAGEKASKKESMATQDDGLQSGERNVAADVAAEKARKNAKDVLLAEAARILGDEVGLLKANTRLAARVLPGLAPGYVQKRE